VLAFICPVLKLKFNEFDEMSKVLAFICPVLKFNEFDEMSKVLAFIWPVMRFNDFTFNALLNVLLPYIV
jgi:hypothetical protein